VADASTVKSRFWKVRPVVLADWEALPSRIPIVLFAVLALTALRLWLQPIGSSLSLDETGTYWVIKDGLAAALERIHHWDSISPAYAVVAWAAVALGGAHEAALRLPSVLSVALATAALYRLAEKLTGRETAFAAASVFVCLDAVVYAAADARPYGLMVLAVILATAALVRWLDEPTAGRLAVYAALAAFAPYTHYLAFTVYGVHAVYALRRVRRGSTKATWRGLAGAAIGTGLLLVPLIPFVLDTYQKRYGYSYAGQPSRPDFFTPFVPILPCFVILAALLLWMRAPGFSLAWKWSTRDADVLIASWALVPIALLFVAAKVSTAEVFLPRYALPAAPGLALLLGRLIGAFTPRWRALGVSAAILVLTTLVVGPEFRFTRQHSPEDWREAIHAVNAAATDDTPVIVYSQFAEASRLGLWRGATAQSSMFSPLSFYPMRGHFFPFAKAENQHIEDEFGPILAEVEKSNRIVVVQPRPVLALTFIPVRPWGADFAVWLEGRLGALGYRERVVNKADSPAVLLFERTSAPASVTTVQAARAR